MPAVAPPRVATNTAEYSNPAGMEGIAPAMPIAYAALVVCWGRILCEVRLDQTSVVDAASVGSDDTTGPQSSALLPRCARPRAAVDVPAVSPYHEMKLFDGALPKLVSNDGKYVDSAVVDPHPLVLTAVVKLIVPTATDGFAA